MEKERKRTHRPQGRVPIPALALFAIVLSVAVLLMGSSGSESEAASYGSGTDPYGGLYADWSDLTDGADYYIVSGGDVMITFEGRSMDGVTITGDSRLSVVPEDSSIYGVLRSNTGISLDGKTINLVAVTVYASYLPVYGAVDYGTIEAPLSRADALLSNLAYATFFVKPGSEVNFESSSMVSVVITALSVTEGYGLSVADDGSITGKLTKTGEITAKIQYNNKSTGVISERIGTLICTEGGKAVSGLTIRSSDSLKMGASITIHADATPSDAAYTDVSWTVSSEGHGGYYVDGNGDLVVIGVSKGDIQITAKSRDGSNVSASKTISVTDADIKIQTIQLTDFTGGKKSLTLDSDTDMVKFTGRYETGKDYTISTYLVNTPEGVGLIAGKTAEDNYVMIPKCGETELHWVDNYGMLGTDTGSFTVIKECTITYDANGGLMSNGQSTMTKTTSGPIELAFPSKEGSTFAGWYDAKDGGKLIGKAGSTYTPDGNVTIYAHWDASTLEVVSEFEWAGGQGVLLSYTPKVKDSITGEEITDFKVEVPKAKDQTGCLYADGSRVYGMMKDLIPGTYTAQVIISKTGYASVTQTITIAMPVYTLEPIDSKTMVGQKWLTNLTMKPDDAYIESFSVKFNDGSATSAQYDAGMSGNKGFYIVCKEEGIYTVSLVLSAPGIPSSTKTITLRAESSGEYSDPPSISSIKVTRYGGASSDNPIDPNTYYLSAIGAANYDTIEWDFGDNSEPSTSGLEQIHRFTPGVYTIKCTVTNVATGQTATASTKLETLDEPSVDTSDMINIGSKYTSGIIRTDYSNPTLVAKTSDGNVLDYFTLNKSTLSDGSYAFVVTGVCNEISLVGKTITFTVSSGSKVIKTWNAVVYAQSGADDIKIEASVKYKVDGLKVTLTDIVPNKASMSLMVDWGDGVLDRDSASATFSHEYSAHGNYTVSMLWKWTSSSGEASQREKTLNIDLQSSETPSVVYHANGGKGTMDSQTGSKTYTIQKCAFVRDGMTCNYWNTSPDLTGTTFKAGDEVSPDGTLDLYAVWENVETEDSKDIIRYAACALVLGIVAVIVVRRYVL